MDSLTLGAMNQPTAFALVLMGVVVGAVVALITLGLTLGMKGVAMQRARLMTPPEVPPMPKPPRLTEYDAALRLSNRLAAVITARVIRIVLERVEGADRDPERWVYVLTIGQVESLAFGVLYAMGGEMAEPIKVNPDGTLQSVHGVLIEEKSDHSTVQVSVEPRMKVVEG